jgi:SEC-C motif-containing protein
MLCPCGSERTFALCCQPLIMATKPANSPEQLMRSRYSAYATQQAKYIYLTYAHSSQAQQSIDDIAQWAAETKWLKLIIHYASDHKKDLANHNNAQVEFSAFYQVHRQIWQMREQSNFVLEDSAWRYLDGEVSDSKALNKPKKNEFCFCGSEKKFKHCCAKTF